MVICNQADAFSYYVKKTELILQTDMIILFLICVSFDLSAHLSLRLSIASQFNIKLSESPVTPSLFKPAHCYLPLAITAMLPSLA